MGSHKVDARGGVASQHKEAWCNSTVGEQLLLLGGLSAGDKSRWFLMQKLAKSQAAKVLCQEQKN